MQIDCELAAAYRRRDKWRLRLHEEMVLDGKDGMRDGRLDALSCNPYARDEQIQK